MNRKVKVYLAGKVDGSKHELAKSIDAEFICSDGGNHSEHNFGLGYYDFQECNHNSTLRELVQTFAIASIHDSDFLFAWLTCPTSYGSIAEIAYASALGKKCFVIIQSSDPEQSDEELFDAYYFVCCFPNVQVQEVLTAMEGSQILGALVAAYRQPENIRSIQLAKLAWSGLR